MILFLDFDGVLHPDSVYLRAGPSGQEPYLEGEGELFQWLPILAEALRPYPDVKIIISSNWQQRFEIDRLKGYLGELGDRVIGGTNPPPMFSRGRVAEILKVVDRLELTDWRALDDADLVHSIESRIPSFIACFRRLGLSDAMVQRRLLAWLEAKR